MKTTMEPTLNTWVTSRKKDAVWHLLSDDSIYKARCGSDEVLPFPDRRAGSPGSVWNKVVKGEDIPYGRKCKKCLKAIGQE